MARCRCTESQCSCLLSGGDGIIVNGSGTAASPWVVSAIPRATGTIEFIDTRSVDFTVTGSGTQGAPFSVTADVTLGDLLTVVDTPNLDLSLTPVVEPITGDTVYELSGTVIAGGLLIADDSADIVWTRSGTGTPTDPLRISADVPCIACDAPGNVGDVLTRQADGTYLPGPPVTAPVGAVSVGPGMAGDGSSGNPIRVVACTYDDTLGWCPA